MHAQARSLKSSLPEYQKKPTLKLMSEKYTLSIKLTIILLYMRWGKGWDNNSFYCFKDSYYEVQVWELIVHMHSALPHTNNYSHTNSTLNRSCHYIIILAS